MGIASSYYDNSKIIATYNDKTLTGYFKGGKLHAYSTSGEVLDKVLTFPLDTHNDICRNYTDSWKPAVNDGTWSDTLQNLLLDDGGVKVTQGDYTRYLADIWVGDNCQGTGGNFRFTRDANKPTSIAVIGNDPIVNNLSGAYTFIANDTDKTQLNFYIQNDMAYPYDMKVNKPILTSALTFPISLPQNKTDPASWFTPADASNLYQKVSRTKDGYIYNPTSKLYYGIDSVKGYLNFLPNQPDSMTYTKIGDLPAPTPGPEPNPTPGPNPTPSPGPNPPTPPTPANNCPSDRVLSKDGLRCLLNCPDDQVKDDATKQCKDKPKMSKMAIACIVAGVLLLIGIIIFFLTR
jgi:hypothetical protein